MTPKEEEERIARQIGERIKRDMAARAPVKKKHKKGGMSAEDFTALIGWPGHHNEVTKLCAGVRHSVSIVMLRCLAAHWGKTIDEIIRLPVEIVARDEDSFPAVLTEHARNPQRWTAWALEQFARPDATRFAAKDAAQTTMFERLDQLTAIDLAKDLGEHDVPPPAPGTQATRLRAERSRAPIPAIPVAPPELPSVRTKPRKR